MIVNQADFATAIDAYIKKVAPANSPFQGLGKDLVAAGLQYGVNPAWVVNIARKESSFGTAGWPAQNAFNAFGRTATSDQPGADHAGRRWYRYDSFKQSVYGQSEYLRRKYIDKGLMTFEAITNQYAPPSENDTAQYINEMKTWVGQVMTLAGAAVNCAGKVETSTATKTPTPQPTATK